MKTGKQIFGENLLSHFEGKVSAMGSQISRSGSDEQP